MSDTVISPAAARVVEGRTVPSAGAWAVDASHSSVAFVARHLMVTKVRGAFSDYSVDLQVGERPEDSSVQVSIDAASISTGDEGRDGHLLSPDFLDVENHPTLTFASTAVTPVSEDTWRVDGALTIRGESRPVVLEVVFSGVSTDPWGNTKAFFEASTEIDREDWGLTWNQPLASGGVLVGKKIKIELDIQATPAG
jgi:polyisoprenoid-binding protein YceI